MRMLNLQTARGEKHTVGALRDLNLKDGCTSAFNYLPVTNTLTGDDNVAMTAAFATQIHKVNVALKIGALPDGTKFIMFTTGDLAFLNAFHGLVPPMASYENGSVWFVGKKGARKERQLDDCYHLSHCKTPHHNFETDGKIKCRVCGFVAESDEDFLEEKKRIDSLSDTDRRNHQNVHEGNVPGLAPVMYIPPVQCLPPIYHHGENKIDYLFKHLIWEEAEKRDNELEVKWDINKILKQEIGYCHLPKNRGKDKVMPVNWIGMSELWLFII